jgi:hypothetical protein
MQNGGDHSYHAMKRGRLKNQAPSFFRSSVKRLLGKGGTIRVVWVQTSVFVPRNRKRYGASPDTTWPVFVSSIQRNVL